MDHADNIEYQIGLCSLGPVLVAASKQGICAVLLKVPGASLVDDLLNRFPEAKPAKDNALMDYLQRVIHYIESPDQPIEVPLDMQGSNFQQQVWQALRQIPCGKQVSYSELAAQIGKPGAFRAVASACARNPLAVIVPCHRVIHKSGSMSGYYWGVDTKRVLQAREAKS